MPLLKYLVVTGVVVVAGIAGYRYYNENRSEIRLPDIFTATSTPATTPTASSSSVLPPAIDATWQTYQNSTLKFLLSYPTKGMYAPRFTVKVVNENDAKIQDGCYDEYSNGEIQRTTLNGVEFCRVIHLAGESIPTDTEFWSTKKDGRIAVISFTKNYSTTTNTSFDVGDYRDFVASLMSTFTYGSNATTTQP